MDFELSAIDAGDPVLLEDLESVHLGTPTEDRTKYRLALGERPLVADLGAEAVKTGQKLPQAFSVMYRYAALEFGLGLIAYDQAKEVLGIGAKLVFAEDDGVTITAMAPQTGFVERGHVGLETRFQLDLNGRMAVPATSVAEGSFGVATRGDLAWSFRR